MKWVLRWLARVYTTTTTSVVEMFKHGGKNGTQQQHFFFPSFWLGEFLTRGKVPWTTLNPRMRRLDPPENLQCGAFFFFFFCFVFVFFLFCFPNFGQGQFCFVLCCVPILSDMSIVAPSNDLGLG
jgi:hypothetical protein